MIAHIVTSCAECPYSWTGGDVQPWVCTAEEPGRALGKMSQPWPEPDAACVLREADRLVTLRVR